MLHAAGEAVTKCKNVLLSLIVIRRNKTDFYGQYVTVLLPEISPLQSITPCIMHGHVGARSIRPKFPKIPVQTRMEQKFSENSLRKLRFTSRGCSFFWKFGNSGNCLSTRYESAPVPLVVKSYKFRVTQHWMQNDLP